MARVFTPAARELRESAGMNMAEAAHRAQVSYDHLRLAETRGRPVSPEVAHRVRRVLSEALGRDVSLEEISIPTDAPAP